jgi:hypothetical protein
MAAAKRAIGFGARSDLISSAAMMFAELLCTSGAIVTAQFEIAKAASSVQQESLNFFQEGRLT